MNGHKRILLVLLWPAAAVITLFFFVPFALTLGLSLSESGGGWGFSSYLRFFQSSQVADLAFTVGVSLASAAIACAFSLPSALIVHRRMPGHQVVLLCSLLPLVVPHILGAYAVSLLYSPNGPLWGLLVGHLHWLDKAPSLRDTPEGLVIALVWKFFPVTFLAQLSALQSIPPSYIEAARVPGSTLWGRFWGVQLPLLMPGLLSGTVMAFVMAATQFSITMVVYSNKGLTTIPMDIFFEVFGSTRGQSFGSALGIILTLTTLAVLWVANVVVRRAYSELFHHA